MNLHKKGGRRTKTQVKHGSKSEWSKRYKNSGQKKSGGTKRGNPGKHKSGY